MSITQGLASPGHKLYAAWKGETGDDRLFYSAFDGATWTASQTLPGNSGVGPSLAALNGQTHAAWKGEGGDSDQRLFHAVFDGLSWGPQAQIQNFGSSVGPSLGALGDSVYAAWKGVEGDDHVYWARLHKGA